MRFQLVGLSTPSVPMINLKVPEMGDDTINTEFLTVGVDRWNKLTECWQLKDKKNSPLIINYLLKHNCVTIICTIYSPSLYASRRLAYPYQVVYLLSYEYSWYHKTQKSLRNVMANVQVCDIVVSEFELQSRYYVHFRTNTLWERH